MITKITSMGRTLKLKGRWDAEEEAPYESLRAIRLRGMITGSGPDARSMMRTARAEIMEAARLCSHGDGMVELFSYYKNTEIRMPARYRGLKQQGDKSYAQSGYSVELEFECMSAFWKGATTSSASSLASGSCFLYMENAGTAPARPLVILRNMAGQSSTVVLTLDNGYTVAFKGEVPSTSCLVFDMAARQVYSIAKSAEGIYPDPAKGGTFLNHCITDAAHWLSNRWHLEDDQRVEVSLAPAAPCAAAELIHINEYY